MALNNSPENSSKYCTKVGLLMIIEYLVQNFHHEPYYFFVILIGQGASRRLKLVSSHMPWWMYIIVSRP